MKDVSDILNELDRICASIPDSDNKRKINGKKHNVETGLLVNPKKAAEAAELLDKAINSLKAVRFILEELAGGAAHEEGEEDLSFQRAPSEMIPQDLLPSEPGALKAARLKALGKIRAESEGPAEDLDDSNTPFVGQVPIKPDTEGEVTIRSISINSNKGVSHEGVEAE